MTGPARPAQPARLARPARPARLGGWRRPALLAAVALVARLLYWWTTRTHPLTSDAEQYHEIAVNLASGLGFSHVFPQLALHPTAFRPPLYPGLLALVYWVLWPSAGLGRLVSVVIGVAVVLTTDAFVRHHAPQGVDAGAAGLTAALAVALYPPLIANDTVTLTEGLSLLLLLAVVAWLLDGHWVAAAIATGLLVLTRASAQGLAVVVAVWVWRRLGWRRAGAFLVLSALVVAPWIVRNDRRLGSPVLVTSNGFNLAAMYSPQARASGGFVDPVFDPRFEKMRILQFDEVKWDSALTHLALQSLRDHPEQVGRVVARNSLAWFEIWPPFNDGGERLDGRNMTIRNATLPVFWVVTVAGLFGFWKERRSALAVLVAVVTAYFMLTSILLVAAPRLRAPFDLVCCIGLGLLVGRRAARAGPVAVTGAVPTPTGT